MKRRYLVFFLLFITLISACTYTPHTLTVNGKVIAVTNARDYTKIEILITTAVRDYDGNAYEGLKNSDIILWFPETFTAENVFVGNEIVLSCLDEGNGLASIDTHSCDLVKK